MKKTSLFTAAAAAALTCSGSALFVDAAMASQPRDLRQQEENGDISTVTIDNGLGATGAGSSAKTRDIDGQTVAGALDPMLMINDSGDDLIDSAGGAIFRGG